MAWVTAPAGTSWLCGLVDGVRGQSVATFAPASFLIQIELSTMETYTLYLRDGIIRGESRRSRIQQEVIRFASRHIPADVYLPTHEFPLVSVTNEQGMVKSMDRGVMLCAWLRLISIRLMQVTGE